MVKHADYKFLYLNMVGKGVDCLGFHYIILGSLPYRKKHLEGTVVVI